MIEVHTRVVEARGMKITYLEAGEGPAVVLTHGFPDVAESWRPTVEVLAGAGFRALAPYTRGISPTTTPPNGDFTAISLAEDLLAFLDALELERVVLVGQDWGALFSHLAVSLAPERVEKLVSVAIPHLRTLKPRLGLLRGTWHFIFFQFPLLPEWFMKRGGWRGIDFFFNSWSPSTSWGAERLGEVKKAYAQPGTLRAALGYYRAMKAAPWSSRARLQRRMATAKTGVPTLTFAGRTDGALPAAEFRGSARAFTGPYELVEVEDAGHFLHLEKPELFHDKLLEFLKT